MKTVIFDFDGTIANSFDHVLSFLLDVSGQEQDLLSAKQRNQLKNLSMQDLALQLGIPRWRLPFLYFRGKAVMSKRMTGVVLFEGMSQVITTLHAEHYELFIISSNSRRNIHRFLAHHGLSSYFTKVYGNVGWFGKGLMLRRMLKQRNLQPSATMYVGDEVRDIIGARLAGMPCVAVNWGFAAEEQLLEHNPMILVRSPSELQKSLTEWSGEQ